MDNQPTITEKPEPDLSIEPGDRVRSFDFDFKYDLEGDHACYVEGLVVAIEPHQGCDRYVIAVDTRIFGGEKVAGENIVLPPVNGTEGIFGPQANVVLIEN